MLRLIILRRQDVHNLRTLSEEPLNAFPVELAGHLLSVSLVAKGDQAPNCWEFVFGVSSGTSTVTCTPYGDRL